MYKLENVTRGSSFCNVAGCKTLTSKKISFPKFPFFKVIKNETLPRILHSNADSDLKVYMKTNTRV